MPSSFAASTSLVEMCIDIPITQGANDATEKCLRVALWGVPWPVENKR